MYMYMLYIKNYIPYNRQVHYPSNPQQPGPIYFLTPRKCAIFGVCCEAIPRQVRFNSKHQKYKCIIENFLMYMNYLIDETVNCGKGANSVISMLHHFLCTHNLGEANLHLHADNCCGQNKNRYVMQYLAWRVLTGLNKRITLSLIVGHTKVSPDWCFGLFKQVFRRTKVGCLDDIARVVEQSAVINHAQLVATQDGKVIVPTYDWAQYFDHPFRQKALKGIKTMHYFTFTSSHKGSVFVRDNVNSA